MSFIAKCDQCGVIERGDFETVGDAAEDHEQFHDVRVQRVATDGGTSTSGPGQFEIQETHEEAMWNRGYITVLEQVREDDHHDVGDRFIAHGHHDTWHAMVERDDGRNFVPKAVPVARIELHRPMEKDEYDEFIKTDLAKALLAPYFEELDQPEFRTERGKEMVDDV